MSSLIPELPNAECLPLKGDCKFKAFPMDVGYNQSDGKFLILIPSSELRSKAFVSLLF